MILERLARRYIRRGRLEVTDAHGRVHLFGDGDGPHVAVAVSRGTVLRIASNAPLRFGEAYADGSMRLLRGDVYDLLHLVGINFAHDPVFQRKPLWRRWMYAARRGLSQLNGRAAARRNVSAHYDLPLEFYRRFLDDDLQYSCAYFARPDMTLDEAQAAKKALVAGKLHLRPGDRVLDVGCGWGGLALTLAAEHGARVTGITLSAEQLATARARAEADGLRDRATFELADYRDVEGPFDRIVSVGMFEHVGRPNYQRYFDRVAELLTDDGVALVHAIGRKDEPNVTNPFIARHIFPGGYIPSLSEVLPAIERAGLWVTDVEVLRLHYAQTVRHWRARFAARREQITAVRGERLARTFEFYLALSEVAFRLGGHMVWQVQLAKRVDALPTTRAYLRDAAPAPAAPADVEARPAPIPAE